MNSATLSSPNSSKSASRRSPWDLVRAFGRKWGHTDYRVSAIPLGGYVKLGGDESNAPIEGAGATDIPEHERFNLRPRWQRILVAPGPVMNVLTALRNSSRRGVDVRHSGNPSACR